MLRHGDLLVAPALLVRLVERLGVQPLDELLDQFLHLRSPHAALFNSTITTRGRRVGSSSFQAIDLPTYGECILTTKNIVYRRNLLKCFEQKRILNAHYRLQELSLKESVLCFSRP